MGYVECRSCSGLKKKFVMRNGIVKEYPCRACDGTGINQRLYSKYCEKCSAEIIYPRDAAFPPKYCKSCKEIIRAEKERKAAEWRVTKCKVCGAEIKYNIHWSKIPDTCKSCIEKERAKWKEKACKKCGATIKYNVGWSKIPELCKSCVEKEKAMWAEKSCKGCGAKIRYRKDWSNIPEYCKSCKDKFKAQGDKIASAAGKKADDVKVRFNPATGKNDVYFGGIGAPDGLGHGHAVVSDTGEVHYLRDAGFGNRKDAVIKDDGKKL